MTGRAGRGAAIAKYLAEKKAAAEAAERQQQEQEARHRRNEQEVQRLASRTEEPPEQPLRFASRGRAMAMMLLRQKHEQLGAGAVGAASDPPPQAQVVSGQAGASRAGQQAAVQAPADKCLPLEAKIAALTIKAPPAAPFRPSPLKYDGQEGRQIKATSNYIRLELKPGISVYEYEVNFDPPVDSNKLRFRFFNEHREVFGSARTFDGVTLYLPHLLPDKVTALKVNDDKVDMFVIFKRAGSMHNTIHLYNVLFKRIMKILDLVRFGRQHYNPKAKVDIPQHRLQIWPGYVTSVDEYEGGVMLCLDSSHRVLRTNTVYDMIQWEARRGTDYRTRVGREVIGTSVLTRYNNRLYRVDDIDWSLSPSSTFDTRRMGSMTFKRYYKEHYDLTITDDDQPLLVSKVTMKSMSETLTQSICLVPEFCYVTGLTDTMRTDFRVMKDISAHMRVTPNQRKQALSKFISNVRDSREATEVLSAWGLTVAQDTINLNARIFEPEAIRFANTTVPGSVSADWGSSATRNHCFRVVEFGAWNVIHCPKDRVACQEFLHWMKRVCPQMGIPYNPPEVVVLESDGTDHFVNALRRVAARHARLVVVICPTARDDRYSAIKKICCIECPMASQVINARTLSRQDKNRSIVQKIALQINCKLGGSLWTVNFPFNDVMVVGIDTYHDTTKKKSSLGGFVASMDPDLTRWYSRVAIQGPHQELIDCLKGNLVMALKRRGATSHDFPKRVIIFRDGVGDGQLKYTKEFEVDQYRSCFGLINPNYHPKLTMIVSQKRINTRIFAKMGSGGDRCDLENPPPGTVLDHTVTRRDWYDFYLVSQHVRQGTVSPTHYIVLHDDSNFQPDLVQQMTYKLCHLYYNWPGTIRVPAPVQYAHKLAQLVGQNVTRQPSDTLNETLFYL